MVVAKKLARRAIVRNTIRRIARETFRQVRNDLPPLDLVLRLSAPAKSLARAQRKDWHTQISTLMARVRVGLDQKVVAKR